MMKRIAFNILMWPGVNEILGLAYKALRKNKILNSEFIFPYRGTLTINFNTETNFKMSTDGADTIAARIHQDGIDAFEPEMGPLFKKLIGESKTFLDVGANTGFYSLLAAKINPACVIHAFEPVPAIFDSLKNNVDINKFEKVIPHLLALSNETRKSSFFVPKSIRISTGASQIAQFDECDEISCQLVRLDEFVEKNNLQIVDFMKIDTETTEPMVIEGGMNTISKYRPTIIVELLNDRVGAKVEELIKPLNYSFYQITPEKLHPIPSLMFGDSRGMNWNFLLVPQEKKI